MICVMFFVLPIFVLPTLWPVPVKDLKPDYSLKFLHFKSVWLSRVSMATVPTLSTDFVILNVHMITYV